LVVLLEDQTRRFWNMSETKTNQVMLSDSSHAKIVEGVDQLKIFTGTSISGREVLDALVKEYLQSYIEEYLARSREITALKDRVKRLEESGYRAIEEE